MNAFDSGYADARGYLLRASRTSPVLPAAEAADLAGFYGGADRDGYLAGYAAGLSAPAETPAERAVRALRRSLSREDAARFRLALPALRAAAADELAAYLSVPALPAASASAASLPSVSAALLRGYLRAEDVRGPALRVSPEGRVALLSADGTRLESADLRAAGLYREILAAYLRDGLRGADAAARAVLLPADAPSAVASVLRRALLLPS